MRLVPLIGAGVVAWSCTGSPPEKETVADPVHLQAAAFTILSGAIREDLQRRGCTIPQSFPDSTPHNVVQGRFMSADEVDAAVLCATDSTTVILVYRGGSDSSVVELAAEPHVDEPAAGDTVFWHSRAINSVDSTYIRVRYERYGGPKPPPIDHQDINDIYVGKGSVVWYWHDGKWLKLQGAD